MKVLLQLLRMIQFSLKPIYVVIGLLLLAFSNDLKAQTTYTTAINSSNGVFMVADYNNDAVNEDFVWSIGIPLSNLGMFSEKMRLNRTSLRLNNGFSMGAGNNEFMIDATNIVGGRLSVLANGNIGIGVPSPTAKLDINGQIKISGGSPGLGRVLTSDANGLATWAASPVSPWINSGSYLSYNGVVNIGGGIPSIGTKFLVTGNSMVQGNMVATDGARLMGSTGEFWIDGTDGSQAGRFKVASSGNVGIGTNAPSLPFVVQKSGRNFSVNPMSTGVDLASTGNLNTVFNGKYELRQNFGSTPGVILKIDSSGNIGMGNNGINKGKLHVVGSLHVENSEGKQTFHVSAGKQLVFVGDSAYIQYMATQNATSSPIQSDTFSLWVSKGIVSEDLILAHVSAWDDYVFDEKYDLPSIDQLAAYVKLNKHLPNIPSEAEVKAKGYSTLRLNRGFLKTIEELTLYTIAQDDQIKILKAKSEEQSELYNALVLQMKELRLMMDELKK